VCGRYANTRSPAELSQLFEAADETPGWTPRYNIAPTTSAPVVRVSRSRGERVLNLARWGLLPPWAKDPRQGARMINARSETVATSRAFAHAFASRRALVPVDGWYEWRPLPEGGKQAYFLTSRDGSPLVMAGIWTRWGPERWLTFAVLTTAALGPLATVHDRMPLLLPPQRWHDWLHRPGPDPALLAATPASLVANVEIRPVGPAVGNVRNDGPDLITPVASPRSSPTPTLF
jgi:putative SOS response-associated peptidase YedK